MRYQLKHENASRLRIRVRKADLTAAEEEKIHFVLDQIPGVDAIEVYNATAGVAVTFHANRDKILAALSEMDLNAVQLPADYIDTHDVVRIEELKKRHLGPKVKMKMRGKILAEMAFDLIAPMPVQAGFHIYQLITLKDF